MKLIVGLGNPDAKYDNTRHNFGFMALDFYANKNNLKFKKDKDSYIVKERDFILLKPLTYMNDSGREIVRIINYYNIDPENLLILHDDKDLMFGQHKISFNRGAGGHNGILSVINSHSSKSFGRLRLGINSDNNINTKNFVLEKFSFDEQEKLEEIFISATDIIDSYISCNITDVMNKYN